MDARLRLPLVGWRYGVDPALGLVPVVGDTISGAISAYIIYEARSAGARKRTIARVILRSGIDNVVCLIPVLGDLFDLSYKANLKNVDLLREDIAAQQTGS